MGTILEPVSFYIADVENHKLKYLEPRVDFFKKHDCQLTENPFRNSLHNGQPGSGS